jgi:DNA/RNA-binding domain of Phe-tRNA-synthetase-like protein
MMRHKYEGKTGDDWLKKMQVELRPELKILYPKAVFGSLTVKSAPNKEQHDGLEERKRRLEAEIREVYPDVEDDDVIQGYDSHFKRWGRTYPIEFQIKSIKKGRRLPRVSVLVDGMFMAELKNRILTSGHDLDAIRGGLSFDVSDKGEEYLKLSGEEQGLPMNDVVLRDEAGILASVLYGPARRSSISPKTRNALYFAWCPHGMDDEQITAHLTDLLSNLHTVFDKLDSEIVIQK